MSARLARSVAALAAFALAATACKREVPEAAPPVARVAPREAIPSSGASLPPVGMSAEDALLINLTKIAVSAPPPAGMIEQFRGKPIDEYIDALLASDAFSSYAASSILLGPILTTPDEAGLQLMKLASFDATIEGTSQKVYHLLEPCDAKDTAVVHPWWAADTEVRICNASYVPTHRVDPTTGYNCGSKNQVDQLRNLAAIRTGEGKAIDSKATYCGCGPSLVLCVPDDATREMMSAALEKEATGSIAQTVREDRPLEDVFTRNETFRDSTADFFYQRTRYLNGEIPSMPPLDKAPASWRPRREKWAGEQSGILTSNHLLYLADGQRDRMRDYFAMLWCSGLGSHGATADQVFALGVTNLRAGQGWQKLAAMPICTSCHAKLDYGMQFFNGHSSAYLGFYSSKDLVTKGSGPIYGDDITDLRGSAELTPAGFARLALKQPEYGSCIAGRVSRHVLGDSASPDDAKALEAVFNQTRRVKPVMREALRRYAALWNQSNSDMDIVGAARPATAAPAEPVAVPAPPSTGSAGSGSAGSGSAAPSATGIAIAQPLRAMIDARCMDCHEDPKAPGRDFKAARLDRGLAEDMLHRVAWHDMPRLPHGLSVEERDRMVTMFIDDLWPAGPDRTSAEHYYLGLKALPSHSALTLRNTFAGTPLDLQLEPLVDPSTIQLSPGLISAIAKAAVSVCNAQGTDFDQCMHEHLAPVLFVNRRLPWLTDAATP